MPAHTPEEVHKLWSEYFNGRDLDCLVALYEENAAFMPQPGQVVKGRAAIRMALQAFLSQEPTFEMCFQKAIETEGVAIVYSSWKLTAKDGTELTGQTSDVVRKAHDDTWLILIDNPYGGKGVE